MAASSQEQQAAAGSNRPGQARPDQAKQTAATRAPHAAVDTTVIGFATQAGIARPRMAQRSERSLLRLKPARRLQSARSHVANLFDSGGFCDNHRAITTSAPC